MRHTTRNPNFTRMNIAAGGAILDALADHRVLVTTLRDLHFVIAHADDRDRAITLAEQVQGPSYTILLTGLNLVAVRDGAPRLDVDVLDARNDHQPAPTQIKVSGMTEVVLPTEHGRFAMAVATADTLRAGDLFTAGELCTDGEGNEYGLTVFRAATDFDPATGMVVRHVVSHGWDRLPAAARVNLYVAVPYGPDRLVHRLTDPDVFQEQVGLRNLDAVG